jgi:hypothetical protein
MIYTAKSTENVSYGPPHPGDAGSGVAAPPTRHDHIGYFFSATERR